MKIQISIQYNTAWGERLVLRLGRRRLEMTYGFGGIWHAEVTGKELKDGGKYGFEVEKDGEVTRREWRAHRFEAPKGKKSVEIRARWTNRPEDSAFYSTAFSQVVLRRKDGASFRHPRAEKASGGNVRFTVAAPQLRPEESLALVGTGLLGQWDKPMLMDDGCFPWWSISLEVDAPFAFKFVIVDTKTRAIRCWEDGPDHYIAEIPAPGCQLVVADLAPVFSRPAWRGAGVAVPLFSLRTADSFGVGDFHDLKKLVDWAATTGLHLIQLLPVNDTTMQRSRADSYPYNTLSSFALHPMYVHLPAAGVRADKAYRDEQAALEAMDKVDYERVNAWKEAALRKLFAGRAASIRQDPAYRAFVEENASWLLPYAVFSAIRDEKGTSDWRSWGDWRRCRMDKVRQYAAEYPDPVDFYCWVQFLLDGQLKDAVAYAHRKGVALKGDLPIGVSRCSVDAWQHPELFNMDSQAGAPPDFFSEDGQNWGFPTYNWERMARDGYTWWKARLRKMEEYFDAYRIDHILGFFRIWEIPQPWRSGMMGHFSPALPYSGKELRTWGFEPEAGSGEDVLFLKDPRQKDAWHPRMGGQKTKLYAALPEPLQQRFDALHEDFFFHRHNAFWKASARRKLPSLVRSTGMLACGEDLGMIPSSVPETMAEMDILSLEIQRMPKDLGEAFARPDGYPYSSVAATGTHDTSTLRGWWEEDPALTQRYYNEVLGMEGKAPVQLEPWIADEILAAHFASESMWVILPIQDYLATSAALRYDGDPADERINIPSCPHHYWRYRLHRSMESILADKAFTAHIHTMIQASGR